jgi:hypothetical protein
MSGIFFLTFGASFGNLNGRFISRQKGGASMKRRGFLQTSSLFINESSDESTPLAKFAGLKADDRRNGLILPPDPMENFAVEFLGPAGSGIKIKKFGISALEKELRLLVLEFNEYGWRELHFFVLDYFCGKYQLDLDIVHHEGEIIRRKAPSFPLLTFRTNLSGEWESRS